MHWEKRSFRKRIKELCCGELKVKGTGTKNQEGILQKYFNIFVLYCICYQNSSSVERESVSTSTIKHPSSCPLLAPSLRSTVEPLILMRLGCCRFCLSLSRRVWFPFPLLFFCYQIFLFSHHSYCAALDAQGRSWQGFQVRGERRGCACGNYSLTHNSTPSLGTRLPGWWFTCQLEFQLRLGVPIPNASRVSS